MPTSRRKTSSASPLAASPGGWLLSVLVLLSLLGGCTPHLGDTEAALALEDLAGGDAELAEPLQSE